MNEKRASTNHASQECGKCKNKFKWNSKYIKCDVCEKSFHQQCTDMHKEAFDYVIKNNHRMTWSCECTPEAAEVIRSYYRLMKKVDKLENNLHEELKEVKEMIEANRLEISKLKANSQADNNSENVLPQIQHQPHTIIRELEERERRQNNLIIFGIPENTSEDFHERQASDENAVKKICEDIDVKIEETDIVKSFRLGKKLSGKNRPLLTNFSIPEKKREVLKNKKRLFEVSPSIKIAPDCTPQQREHDKKVYEEIKPKNNEEQEADFLYIAVGKPGERKMRRVKKRVI